MNPKIIAEKQLNLFGMSYYGDPFDTHSGWDEDNHIGLLWKRFMAYLAQNPASAQASCNDRYCYEVHITHLETNARGEYEIFVGMEMDIAKLNTIPVELSVKVLPLTAYAVFTFSGQEIVSDWEKTIKEWLDSSGYSSPYSYNFQRYDERFKGLDNLVDSTLEVYLPIKKAA
jgi:predicted transcriptional regulator YdeE